VRFLLVKKKLHRWSTGGDAADAEGGGAVLLSRAHRAYGRKSCTVGGEETTPQDFGVVAGREGEADL